jgi:IS4 transposase
MLPNAVQARWIVALAEVDGREREMTFLTNQLEWSAMTVVELYRCRWEIELLFRQVKQRLKLCDVMS